MEVFIQSLLAQSEENESSHYKILSRIYEEQYEVKRETEGTDTSSKDKDNDEGPGESQDERVLPKAPKEIKSSSVQSIHDPQAAYRT